MKVIITPSTITGSVTAPASKSAMQRACAAALIKEGVTILRNPGISADDKAALRIIQQLGAKVEMGENTLTITSQGVFPVASQIDCGESGLSVRMFTSIAALSNQPMTITGSGSLTRRPLHFFGEVLPRLGVACSSNEGFLPLQVQGPVHPANIEVDGSLSSQFLTGLLMAYSAADAKDVTIKVHQLNSKPYIDLTLKVMESFGLKAPVNNQYKEFYFPGQSIVPFANETIHYTVEGDWSGGAFLLVAGAVNGDLTIKGLDLFSTQADKAIIQALAQSEAVMSIREDAIDIKKSMLKPFHFNATDCPDLFPPLAALAAYCKGTSVIEGVHRLTHKESNRALTLQEELGKLGVDIILQDDLMVIKGGSAINGAVTNARHDHRIAMACAVAGLGATGNVAIEGAEAVNKSYPQFWDHLQLLHAGLTLQ